MDVPFLLTSKDLADPAEARLNRLIQTICSQIQPATSAADAVPVPIAAPATATLTLTTSYQNVVGMSIQLTKAGWWKFDVTAGISAANGDFQDVILVTGGITLPGLLQTSGAVAGGMGITATRVWIFQSQTGAEIIQVQAKMVGSGSNAVVGSTNPTMQVSQIIAVFVTEG
jgi:hypothetical protein